jgi:hypothetical protein
VKVAKPYDESAINTLEQIRIGEVKGQYAKADIL